MRISKIELFHVRPRWTFLKMSTDEGLVGWGEAVLEARSRSVEMAVKELEPHLIGQDPRRIEHLWQGMYRGGFYRGGPILLSAISGLEQAMWDILGKSLGTPVYQLLGGAVRSRIRMYKGVGGIVADEAYTMSKRLRAEGFTMVKTGLEGMAHLIESPSWIARQVDRIERIREAIGPDCELAIDFHGKVSPALAIQLIKALEPIHPAFIEEPCLPENVDAMVTIARSTTVPIATGERLFTKWAFREVLEKQAAVIVQPDLAHCGGIMEGKKIAAMAETYYAGFASHNPLGPINLAASLQLAANVPNFVCQEYASEGEGYLKQPFVVKDGYIELPTGPGLGIEVDEEALQDKLYSGDWDIPRWFHADDGSVADF
ncbi:galactonate dehydratase [Paenibacillus sp. HJGM_3]|uniref:galactonate dehydratase n=1 Tax=Paenibacillus sp. HJGM_3 TaxID=3379816 RepID=UPI003858E63B